MLEGAGSEEGTATATPVAYASTLDHISDELRRLDLLIGCRLPRQPHGSPVNPLQQFKGLVLTNEEIRELLGNPLDLSSYESDQNESPDQNLQSALDQMDSHIRARRTASLNIGIDLRLPRLTELFDLTGFEEQCLLICLAPELNRKYEKLYAYLQDDVTRRKASVDVVLNLLCRTMYEKVAARLAFDPGSPLLKYRLVQVTDDAPDGPSPLLSRFLKVDDRIVSFLLGFDRIDSRLTASGRVVYPRTGCDEVGLGEQILSRMRRFMDSRCGGEETNREEMIFHFFGPYGTGKRLLTEAVCYELGLPLLVVDVVKVVGDQAPLEETIWLLGREAVLQSASLCLQEFDRLLDDKHASQLKSLFEVAKTFSLTVFLLSSRSWNPPGPLEAFIEVEMPIPDAGKRKRLWETHLNGRSPLSTFDEANALASKFRLTPGQIQEAVAAARNLARLRSPEDGELTVEDLRAACRAQSDPKLRRLARKIRPIHRWNDIVLPPDTVAQLGEMCHRVNQSSRVLGEWRFGAKLSTGKGVNALFAGPSGAGKTMAAEILANELGLELYKIDLSQVVSKYIGETEKNLDAIFAAAETGNVILFFDEADSLFGKRSEVRDSHDRYANIEISYLLQKIEEYEGVAILATNLSQNLDEAFVRRLAFSIHFPFPDEGDRCRIWFGIWPDEVPLAEDVDLNLLARQFKLSGGSIKNVALAAAFFAAGDGGIVNMSHLLQATRREFQKLGKVFPEFDPGEIARESHAESELRDFRQQRT